MTDPQESPPPEESPALEGPQDEPAFSDQDDSFETPDAWRPGRGKLFKAVIWAILILMALGLIALGGLAFYS